MTKLGASDGSIVNTFPVGQSPIALAFDGSNIWVANNGDRSVTKLRAVDGSSLGTFPAGNYPAALAFDGANIWVAGGSLTQFRAQDGARLAIFAFNTGTVAVVFDGAHVWVSDQLYGIVNGPVKPFLRSIGCNPERARRPPHCACSTGSAICTAAVSLTSSCWMRSTPKLQSSNWQNRSVGIW